MKRKANQNANRAAQTLRRRWHEVYQAMLRARSPERQLQLYRELKAIEAHMRHLG